VRVPFHRIESTELGGIAEDVLHITHPDNLVLAEEVAEFCGLDVIGVDIISEDISKAWHENGAKINEINFAPMVSPYRPWVQKGLDDYVQEIFPHQGRIPIHVFTGGETALNEARRRQADLWQAGEPHFLCTRSMTLKPDGSPRIDDLGDSLFLRAHALLLDKTTEGIIVVLQDESILATGFPFDSVSSKVAADDGFLSASGTAPLDHEVRVRIAKMVDQLPIIDGTM
jgi:cyanophycin synthetase